MKDTNLRIPTLQEVRDSILEKEWQTGREILNGQPTRNWDNVTVCKLTFADGMVVYGFAAFTNIDCTVSVTKARSCALEEAVSAARSVFEQRLIKNYLAQLPEQKGAL